MVRVNAREKTRGDPMHKYTTQDGDTLQRIAERFYGDSSRWKPIFDANRHIIQSPDRIEAGWTIHIPAQ
jgi:nucleoid-associated protein YgaU